MSEEKLYFAYGSNINLDQMDMRCPDARVVGTVVLEGYELLFRGNLRGMRCCDDRAQRGFCGARSAVEHHAAL